MSLHHFALSSDHFYLKSYLSEHPDFLIIQDLDGVCMGLVRDPKRRTMDADYIRAVRAMAGQFYVLTNGEHIGSRGVNPIVEAAFATQPSGWVQQQGLYLPGLAAGGVQWQGCDGDLDHPGVSAQEMAFLKAVPDTMHRYLSARLSEPPFALSPQQVAEVLDVIVLDNLVSPTLNIGSLHDRFGAHYPAMQRVAAELMEALLQQAAEQGLEDSFFVHLAPNLGTQNGRERLKPAAGSDMGTTDFQFMLRGAVKEAGVLVLLNRYYFARCGEYPLGEDFSVRVAPRSADAMRALAESAFDPALMPSVVGVGDTVTSVVDNDDATVFSRGGSDRGFLTLVQQLGESFHSDNAVVWVDSSGGELNRPGLSPQHTDPSQPVPLTSLQGITDEYDPLQLNLLFAGGYQQYIAFFRQLASLRQTTA